MSSRFVRLLAAPVGLVAICAAAAVLADGMAASAAPVAASGGIWQPARALPGIGSLNKGGTSAPVALSCGSPGNCAAGGYYLNSKSQREAFVADQRKGLWHAAVPVPGIGALNKGGFAQVLSVSCSSAGNCGAGGMYLDGSGHYQAFVVTEKNGKWGNGILAPGTKTLNADGNAAVQSVSCAKAGDCSAGGFYRDGANHKQAFVIDSHNGSWKAAKPVPGLITLNQGGFAQVSSVSCSGAGSCAAGGFYEDASAQFQGFVVTEKSGTWAAAQDVPGLGTLNVGGFAEISVVSCSPAGSCAAGGYFHTGPTEVQPFTVTRPSGKWGTASPVKGVLALNAGQDAFITSLSCASGGNCSAAGSYTDSLGHSWPFVVSEKNAKWGTAIQAPGVSKLSGPGRFGEINSVSCESPGNCAAAGQYDNATSHSQAFVIVQHNGTWSSAVNVPGLSALDKDHSSFTAAVSCHAPAGCTASGAYHDARGRQQTFVLTTR